MPKSRPVRCWVERQQAHGCRPQRQHPPDQARPPRPGQQHQRRTQHQHAQGGVRLHVAAAELLILRPPDQPGAQEVQAHQPGHAARQAREGGAAQPEPAGRHGLNRPPLSSASSSGPDSTPARSSARYSVRRSMPSRSAAFFLLPPASASIEGDVAALQLVQRRPVVDDARGLLGPAVVDADVDLDGQVRRQHHLALGHGHRPLDRVLQLAHVARPVVPPQHLQRLARHAGRRATLAAGDLGQEVRDQDGDVVGAVAQRRQLHGDHVDPEIEVFAEAAGLHLRLQIAVGGAHQPHVHLRPPRSRPPAAPRRPARCAAAGPASSAPCPRSRRGTACRRRPARTGRASRATAPVNAPRTCPNSSDSSSDSDSAVQLTGTNGLRPPGGTGVDRPGHQLLAGARLAHHQHGGAGGRHPGHQLVHLQHARALALDLRQPRRLARRCRRCASPPPGACAPAPGSRSAAAPRR